MEAIAVYFSPILGFQNNSHSAGYDANCRVGQGWGGEGYPQQVC